MIIAVGRYRSIESIHASQLIQRIVPHRVFCLAQWVWFRTPRLSLTIRQLISADVQPRGIVSDAISGVVHAIRARPQGFLNHVLAVKQPQTFDISSMGLILPKLSRT